MFWDKKKTGAPKVIQIAVAGEPTSGKTILIDSLFRLMGAYSPAYLDNLNFSKPDILELVDPDSYGMVDDLKGYYKSIKSLNSHVTDNFHKQALGTNDSGIWDEHTYKAVLLEKKSPRLIFLVRNISGEMFNVFFGMKHKGIEYNTSLNDLFMDFRNSKQGNAIRIEFDKPAEFKDNAPKLLDQFIAFLKQVNTYQVEEFRPLISTHFFAYLFYISSPYSIYCLDTDAIHSAVNGVEEKAKQTMKILNTTIERMSSSRSQQALFVITKIDLGFSQQINAFSKIMNENNSNADDLKKLDNIDNYWTFVSYLHEVIDSFIENQPDDRKGIFAKGAGQEVSDLVYNTVPRLKKTTVTDNVEKKNIFFSSATFHSRRGEFINIKSNYEPDNVTAIDFWHGHINNARTPIGVLELLLRILHDNNINLNSLGVLPRSRHNHQEILKKVTGLNQKKS